MKNKIQKFSKGDFQSLKPTVLFDETNLVLIIGEGEVFRGSFTLRTDIDANIRGLVYASSFRVKFKNQGFEGNPAKVEFTYDGRNLRPGHVERGVFTVVCDGGEFELAFTAIIEKPYVNTSYGKIQSTDDFKKLAIKDFSEAGRLFRSKSFYEILKYENERTFYLYDNMRKWSLGDQALEEFLVGIKQKECIFLTISGEGMLFEDIKEPTKATLTITKNTWGYIPIRMEAQGDFIYVSRPDITTEDFVGNVYEFEYFVRPEHLHGGRNFGKIKFITPYEELTYDIEVLQNQSYDENHRMPQLLLAQIIKDYIGFSAGRIDLNSWTDSATEKATALRKLEPVNEMYQLMQAHIYVIGKRMDEAKQILENYNYNRFAIGKDATTNCYYQFLTAMVRGEEGADHADRVLDEIGKTYMQHQDSWILLSMLLEMDPRYKNAYKRLEVLEQQYQFEIHSVIYYLQAYQCYQEKPSLLKKFGPFEVQVLNFATKYRLITREVALYVANFISQQKYFNDAMFRILVRIYNSYDDLMILNTICTFLIKGNKNGGQYFSWYKKAVDADLKIAQLYEYYMMTIDEDDLREPLPKSLILYFMHGNTLNYRKAACLYANLVIHEEEAGDLYLAYREQMVKFTWDQLMKRHITEALKVLYKRFCTEDEMTYDRLVAMRDICYAYEVKTKTKHMKCVLVIEKDGSISQSVPYDETEGAVICLYDKEARIVWEALNGRHYTDSIVFDTKRLFYEPRFLDMCKHFARPEDEIKEEKDKPSLASIKVNGIDAYDEKEVFRLCNHQIRDTNYEEDDFITHLAFELLRRGQYDRVTLMYLANYYCGPTQDMKHLWKILKEYEIPSYKMAERIVTQMLFSENMFREEKIFEDYYLSDNVYFRLKQAYLAFASREYIVNGRATDEVVFEIICNECDQKEELADICKIAVLKYYSSRTYDSSLENVLHTVLREMCERQMIFPYYLNYKKEWLKELQLYDKTMILYQASPGSCVRLYYKLKKEGKESLGYQSELLTPMYENIYVKQFVLYDDEKISYYIQEFRGRKNGTTDKCILQNERHSGAEGKYGRLNEMTGMTPAKKKEAMLQYQEELILADRIFQMY